MCILKPTLPLIKKKLKYYFHCISYKWNYCNILTSFLPIRIRSVTVGRMFARRKHVLLTFTAVWEHQTNVLLCQLTWNQRIEKQNIKNQKAHEWTIFVQQTSVRRAVQIWSIISMDWTANIASSAQTARYVRPRSRPSSSAEGVDMVDLPIID